MKRKGAASSQTKDKPAILNSFWLPAIFFLAVLLIEIALSFSAHNYVEQAFSVHGQILGNLQWACWILAALLLFFPSLRKYLTQNLEGQSRLTSAWKHWGPLAVSVEFAMLLCFLKYCQYRGSQLPEDTTVMVQRAFDTLHGNWFQSSVYGTNYFSIHFAFVMDLLSPILLIWRSALPFLFLQCIAIGSLGLAAYHLVFRLSASSYAGFIAMLLVYSCPAYSQLCLANLNDGAFLAPFLLWALVCWEYERWVLCIVFMALAAATREHFPFSLAGLGAYALFRRRPLDSASLRVGAAIIVGAVLLWFAEMKLIGSFQDTLGFQGAAWESYFHNYGFAGANRNEFLLFLLRHPLSTFANTFYPIAKSLPALKLILYSALFPVAAPFQLVPFCIALLPQLMAESGTPFHDMALHYSSLVFGLLVFSTAHGIANVHRWLKGKQLESFLLIPVLLVCGLGFMNSQNPLLSNWLTVLFDSTPVIPSIVPADASLWTDEFFGAWAPARAQLKVASGFPDFNRDTFTKKLFKPEFVLLQRGWITREKSSRTPILLYLIDNHYIRVGEAPGIVLLRAPDYPHPGGISPPTTLPTPTDDQQAAFNDFSVRYQHMIAGIKDAPPSNPSAELRRIEGYCAYLMGAGS